MFRSCVCAVRTEPSFVLKCTIIVTDIVHFKINGIVLLLTYSFHVPSPWDGGLQSFNRPPRGTVNNQKNLDEMYRKMPIKTFIVLKICFCAILAGQEYLIFYVALEFDKFGDLCHRCRRAARVYFCLGGGPNIKRINDKLKNLNFRREA